MSNYFRPRLPNLDRPLQENRVQIEEACTSVTDQTAAASRTHRIVLDNVVLLLY